MASIKLTAAIEFGYAKFAAPELITSKQTEKILGTDQYKDHTRIGTMTTRSREHK